MSQTGPTPESSTKISKLVKCDKCRRHSVWMYAPSDGRGFYCDLHVPRGCSCNESPLIHGVPAGHFAGDIMVPRLDERGRTMPCCEYEFEEDGFDEEECE